MVLGELTGPDRPWTHLVLNEDEQSGQLHDHVRPLPASEVWLDLDLGRSGIGAVSSADPTNEGGPETRILLEQRRQERGGRLLAQRALEEEVWVHVAERLLPAA